MQGSITTGASGPPVINLPHNHVPDLHAVAMARCRSFSDTEGPENFMDSSFPPVNLSSFPEITDGPGIKDEQGKCVTFWRLLTPQPPCLFRIYKLLTKMKRTALFSNATWIPLVVDRSSKKLIKTNYIKSTFLLYIFYA